MAAASSSMDTEAASSSQLESMQRVLLNDDLLAIILQQINAESTAMLSKISRQVGEDHILHIDDVEQEVTASEAAALAARAWRRCPSPSP